MSGLCPSLLASWFSLFNFAVCLALLNLSSEHEMFDKFCGRDLRDGEVCVDGTNRCRLGSVLTLLKNSSLLSHTPNRPLSRRNGEVKS